MNYFKFSLVLCTLGQDSTLNIFLDSLLSQNYSNYELILVDQNSDSRVDNVISKYNNKLNIIHVKSDPGLSKSRNIGLDYCTGDIVCFPDDDCEYTPDMLYRINKFFNENTNVDFLSIKMTNSVSGGRVIQKNTSSQEITKYNCMHLVASISMFFKSKVIKSISKFDENLGLGCNTIFKGSEDLDYPLNALYNGFYGYYNKDIDVLHPWDDESIDASKNILSRAFSGGAAEMYVLNKYNFSTCYKFIRVIRRSFIIIYYLLKFNTFKAKHSFFILKGMLEYFKMDKKIFQ